MADMTQEQVDTKVKNCWDIPDNSQSMECMVGLIKEAETDPGVCGPHLALFTRDGCEFCAEEKQAQKRHLGSGAMREVSLDTPEGAKLAADLGVELTPWVMLLDCHNKPIEFPGEQEE